LRREFEKFGPIKKIVMAQDESGKPRGYAFIEYEHERDMHGKFIRRRREKSEVRKNVDKIL
jgi:U1 small nuclear ribonucleoprotein 70kDa